MKNHKSFLSFILLFTTVFAYAQNLPSLLTEKNINSTFSILAYDENTQEWGIAVATNNIYVGNSTIYIEPGVGAFSVIAETEPGYAIAGFEKLKEGKTIKQAITEVKDNDDQSNYRQISGMDAKGNIFAFTGKSLKYWKGNASEILGENYVVIGNQLADDVLQEMCKTFENSKGTLAQRLLKSLVAGQNTGGQISGKQSAAVVVKGTNNDWYNQIDLRVDNSKEPIKELQILMDYHYGRIRLNQSLYAIREGNSIRAKQKLTEAEAMLDGWTGMYSKIAGANVIIGNEDAAVQWIKKGLSENPNWSVNLPAFYFLHKHPEMKSIIKPSSFSITDWESALGMFSNLGRELELINLAKNLIGQNVESSYLNYLLGRSYFFEKEQDKAIVHLEKALKMDGENIEAEILLKRIKTK
ncbi:DUF1028 domain-containing protein [Maribacter algarum]|uniref:DUF1028 domain-containing protein n=1 Tax=Maribacter algarum (ex Zhang et al. 2020) TaxID=2578118 RepID=A0A5S3QJH4_9FLAO|nr:DUF1028 domain-containing protein [Maribacter algarum]TMM57974.1 DUF1028 domain-containing protein [Maribacter algarum]